VIQIALAVDGQGLPLRWEVLPGNVAEATVLPDWLDALAPHEELAALPLVFDRRLASEDNFVRLLDAGRRFVTCASLTNLEKWDVGVSLAALADLPDEELLPKELARVGLDASENEDIFYVDLGVRRPPNMKRVPSPRLRIVPYFRPSLCVRNRESLRRLDENIASRVVALNEQLRSAKRSRQEKPTRKKIEDQIKRFGVADAYTIYLDPYTIKVPGKPDVASFQIRVEHIKGKTARELNAGWMLLLAHPDDHRAPLKLVDQYFQKNHVEHAFGVIKSFVGIQPLRHQTDNKIRTHVTLCVLGLLLDRDLELRLRSAGITDATDRVWETLEQSRLQVYTFSKGRRRVTRFTVGDTEDRAHRVLAALGMTHFATQEYADTIDSRRY